MWCSIDITDIQSTCSYWEGLIFDYNFILALLFLFVGNGNESFMECVTVNIVDYMKVASMNKTLLLIFFKLLG